MKRSASTWSSFAGYYVFSTSFFWWQPITSSWLRLQTWASFWLECTLHLTLSLLSYITLKDPSAIFTNWFLALFATWCAYPCIKLCSKFSPMPTSMMSVGATVKTLPSPKKEPRAERHLNKLRKRKNRKWKDPRKIRSSASTSSWAGSYLTSSLAT